MRIVCSILILAAGAAAQNFVVSPIVHTSLEGPSNNTYPWSGMFRYQQVHTDLSGTPRLFTGIAWRRNQDQFLPTGSIARQLDMEVNLCDSSLAVWSPTFANNYAGMPVNVFVRKQVNTPNWNPPIVQRPAPFDYALAFDRPFVYLGVSDLMYEVFVYANSTSASFQCDAVAHSATVTSMYGTYTSEGSGCTTGTGTFQLRSQIQHLVPSNVISFAWDMTGAPSAAGGALLIGRVPLNAPVPGLCTNLYTDGGILAVPFLATPAGTATTAPFTVPYDPSWVGPFVTGQSFALDATQPGLPVAASQGVRCEVPPAVPPVSGARLWALGNPMAITGSSASTSWLVTQFRY